MALDTSKLSGKDRDAYAALKSEFESYNLGTLAAKILDFVRKGYGDETIHVLLSETKEYKDRFAGNEARRSAGLAVLDPRSYLAMEEGYRQVLSSAGMPKGFYDQHSDFVNWIGKDVSVQEIQRRTEIAVQNTTNADPVYKDALQKMGFSQGDMAAAMLDQKRAMPLLEKQVRTAQIAAEAMRQHYGFDKNRAGVFADMGVSVDQARSAYSNIGEFLPQASKLGNIYGENYNQATAEDELLGGSGTAATKRKKLGQAETANFSGAGGVGKSSLNKNSAGSY